MNNALFTIEQVDGKLMITVEAVKAEHHNPTMIRSNDGNSETIEFINPPLTINTDKVGLDLSKYKPFPEGYKVQYDEKIRSIKVIEFGDVKNGAIGTIVGDGSTMPKFICDNESDYINGESDFVFEPVCHFAPLDPSDHPDYKTEEVGVNNAEQITAWFEDRICETLQPQDRHGLIDQINALVAYELNKAKL